MSKTLDQIPANKSRTVKLVYFAWVRERVGRSEETATLPGNVETISDLMSWLAGRGPEYAEVFAIKKDVIRAAIDQTHVAPEDPIGNADEIAFFPPVTGG